MNLTFDRLRNLPLLWVSLAFLAGTVLASQVSLPTHIWLILAGGMLAFAIVLKLVSTRLADLSISVSSINFSLTSFFLPVLALVFLFLGAARYRSSIPEIDAFHIAWYNDREYDVLVTGILDEPPDYRDTYTNLQLDVEAVDSGSGDLPVNGLLLARVFPNETYEYGDRIRLRGRLTTPPENEDFSYREYLARQGIHSYMTQTEVTRLPGEGGNSIKKAIYAFKDETLARVYLIFPDPEASLLAGILLGVDTGLSRDLQQAFKDTGTAHIIAISGFNIAIIAGLFFTLFSRVLGQLRGSIAAILGIAVYTFLVGADAAVVRAAIIGTFALVAHQFGRRNDGLNILVLTGAIMTAFNPHTPWDVDFQLSFAATLGLILYAEPFQAWAVGIIKRYTTQGTTQKIAAPLSEYFLFTLAAQLTTLPIMAYHFKHVSLISLVANPFILPAQPAVMILGGLALILSYIWIPLGAAAALIAWPFASYIIRLVEYFSGLPNGVLVLGDVSILFVILFYTALLTWTFAGHRLRAMVADPASDRPTIPVITTVAVMAVAVMVVWRAAFTVPDGKLHLTFLDVGSADSILVETPGGKHLLINGGPRTSLLSDGLGRRLPPAGQKLDWLIIASTQENQLTALPRLVERIPPANVLWSGNVEASFSARLLSEWFANRDIPLIQAETDMELNLGDGITLRVLNSNSRGAVLLLAWDDFRAVLPFGMSFDALEELGYGSAFGPASVLLLADSGYAPSNPPKWIDNLNPQVIVLNVASGDKDGLPHPATLEAVEDYLLLRTDQNGWIQVSTDGSEMWLQVEKQVEDTDRIIE